MRSHVVRIELTELPFVTFSDSAWSSRLSLLKAK